MIQINDTLEKVKLRIQLKYQFLSLDEAEEDKSRLAQEIFNFLEIFCMNPYANFLLCIYQGPYHIQCQK